MQRHRYVAERMDPLQLVQGAGTLRQRPRRDLLRNSKASARQCFGADRKCKKIGTFKMCSYCEVSGQTEKGWIETDNNGPIVPCPVCNDDGHISRWDGDVEIIKTKRGIVELEPTEIDGWK